jgi:hypothetical protein
MEVNLSFPGFIKFDIGLVVPVKKMSSLILYCKLLILCQSLAGHV